jgi:Domain of unknown function (DUF4387)
VPDGPVTIGHLAEQVRSKNAGPFWITLDIFLRADEDYESLLVSGVLTPERIGKLYRVEARDVQIYEVPRLRVIKISFPRSVTAGSFHDRDQHAGQQHIPLASLIIPAHGLRASAVPTSARRSA